MEDEASDVDDNNEEDFGWLVAPGRRPRAGKKSSAAANAAPCYSQASRVDAATGGGTRAANPGGAFKESYSQSLKDAPTAGGASQDLIAASGLTEEQASEDVVCPNFTQNIVVVSTPEPDHAARYVRIKSFKIVETEYEVNAYETAPHATCEGVIRRVDIRDSQTAITRNIVHDRNPLALAAKRIKTSASVIVIFDGLRVPKFVRYGPTLVR
ncbi:hypothetical protein MTO96_038339 [Rhipicephalus appendiculatus]